MGVRDDAATLERRRHFLTVAVLALSVALALAPAVIGSLALFGVLR